MGSGSSGEWESEPEPFSEAEAAELLKIISSAGDQAPLMLAVDVDALASAVQGIADPIGQLAGWLADRLREMSSWLADTVARTVRSLYDSMLMPVLEWLRSGVSQLNTYIQRVWDSISAVPQRISEAFSSLSSMLSSAVASLQSTVSSVINTAIGGLRSAVDAGLRSLMDAVSRVSSALSSAVDAIRSAVASVVDSVSRSLASFAQTLWSGIQSGFEGIRSVFTSLHQWLDASIRRLMELLAAVPQRVSEALSSALASLSSAVTSALSSLQSAVTSALTTLLSTVRSSIEGLWSGVQRAFDGVRSVLEALWRWLESAVRGLSDAVAAVAKRVSEALSSLLSAVASALSSLQSAVTSALSALASTVVGSLRTAVEALWSGIQRISEGVRSVFESLWRWLESAFNRIAEALAAVPQRLAELWSAITSALSALATSIQSAIASAAGSITASLRTLAEALWSGVQRAFDGVRSVLEALWRWLESALQRVWDAITAAAQRVSEALAALASTVSSALTALQGGISSLTSSLVSAIRASTEALWSGIQSGFKGVASVFEALWRWLDASLGSLAQSLAEFAANVRSLGAMVMGGVNQIAKFLSDVPGAIGSIFKPAIDTIVAVGQSIQGFLQSPGQWIRQNILDPIILSVQGIAEEIGRRITTTLQLTLDHVVSGAKWLGERVVDISHGLMEFLVQILQKLFNTLRGMPESLVAAFKALYSWIIDFTAPSKKLMEANLPLVQPYIDSAFKELGISTPPYLTPANVGLMLLHATWITALFGIITLSSQMVTRAIIFVMRSIAASIGRLVGVMKVHGHPFGVGASVNFSPLKALSSAIFVFARELSRIQNSWFRYSLFSVVFWHSRVVARVFTLFVRNHFPLVIPPMVASIEAVRRGVYADSYPRTAGKSFSDLYSGIRYYFAVRGHADFFTDLVLADESEFHTTITDRFGTVRRIPLALRYVLPTAADVVRWLIRDVVIPPAVTKQDIERNITRLFGIRGLSPDVAKLYYIAGFRYPSPSMLARFYWRGVAKMLWSPDSMEERAIAEAVGAAYGAVPPRKLNEDIQTLNRAISLYWRWHDYAPFAWYPGFTTDKAIVYELTADIPGRIDIRWMMRWGVLEHISAIMRVQGIPPDAPIQDIVSRVPQATGRELVSTRVSPGITFDVRLMARLLEATGLHPDFVPLVAVAQAHQIISDEMTLARTGFLAAYREGLISLDVSEQLMSGLFTVSFRTGFIDPSTGEFREFTYSKPVLWLPAERRMLQMRAVFDRYTDLWRDFMREVVAGVRRIAIGPDEAGGMMTSFFAQVREMWGSEIAAVSGVQWHPELDSSYLRLWMEYARLTRLIEVRIWVRNYVARLMGWLMYRVSYGWLTEEDYTSLLSSLVRSRWLTEEEAQFFRQTFEWLAGIVRREYIPTPSMLATLAEYLVVPESIAVKAFDALRVPEEFRSVYLEYIRIKPVKSDFKLLINAYRRAYVKGVVSGEEWGRILEEARAHGFTEKEIEILRRRADVEELMDSAREYIPTLPQLVAFAEYTSLPDAVVDTVLTARGVREPWASLWRLMVRVRPLKTDFRQLIDACRRALVRGVITEDEWRKILEEARSLGFTDAEVSIIQRRADVEVRMEAAEVYTPTMQTLASLAEYIVVPDQLVNTVAELQRVREPWLSMWRHVIRVRPLKPDFRQLIDVYRRALARGLITEDEWRKILEEAKLYGFTDAEVSILQRRVAVELMLQSSGEYIPTLPQLVTFAEYTHLPDSLIDSVLSARGVREPWASMWRSVVRARAIADDARVLLASYTRAVRSGVQLPDDLRREVERVLTAAGVSRDELAVRELAAAVDALMEAVPTLSVLAAMAEQIDVPRDYIVRVLALRRVDKVFADLWLRYIDARTVSAEVSRVVTAFTRLYERYAVPQDLQKRVEDVMAAGGWTSREMSIWQLELELRRALRELNTLVPDVRTLAFDGLYTSGYEKAMEEVLRVYGIAAERYRAELERLKRVVKNRRLWRHFSWWRYQLARAYAAGLLTLDQVRARLQAFRDTGLLDDDEVKLVIDGMELQRIYAQRPRR